MPVEATEILVGVEPQERIAVAGDAHHVEAGAVAVALLVGADRHLRDVGVHGAVGEHEHDVGAAGAAVAPRFQFDRCEVGDEIGLPHVVARPHGDEVAFAGEIRVLAGARGELEIGFEHEALVVEGVHDEGQVGGRDEQRALAPAAVEMTVLRVERDREQAARTPFEALLAAVGELDLGRAGAFEHADHVFVEVALRRRRAAGRYLEKKHVGEVAAALEMHRRGFDAGARPHRSLDLEEVDAVVLDDGQAFLGDPVEIGVDAVARLVLGHHVPPRNRCHCPA